ncbi:MAG TPA: hypothetical protein VJB91_01090 [Patescibacteria group bacterium]|nr:hypothetical protein [Patescibacteria group bacterium]
MKISLRSLFFLFLGMIGVGALVFLNHSLMSNWLTGMGPSDQGSIEVSYISMARFLVEFFPNLSWAPYWYFGFPFHLFYTPVLPILTALTHQLFQMDYWQAYRILTGVGYLGAPVSVFLFTWYLVKKGIAGFFAGIVAGIGYSLFPTIFYFVLKTNEVLNDRMTDFLEPRRFVLLQRYGEGPHTLALVFLPLGALFFLKTLRDGSRISSFLAAFFIGLTALTNAIAFFALVVLLLLLYFGRITMPKVDAGSTLVKAMLAAIVTYGLIAFWYNTSFMSTFFTEGGGAGKNLLNLFPWGFVGGFFLLLLIYVAAKRFLKNEALLTPFLWFAVFYEIIFVYYTSAPPELFEQRLEFAPQAIRYLTEVDMALSIFVGAVVGTLVGFFTEKKSFLLRGVGICIGGAAVVSAFLFPWYLSSYLNHASLSEYSFQRLASTFQEAAKQKVKLEQTGEYEMSQYLTTLVDKNKGERVFVAGNYGFYLNYFTDIWQLRGGLYQASTNRWPEHIYYLVRFWIDPETTTAWLKAGNISYIVVNSSSSRNSMKEYREFEKFKTLPSVYEKNGDTVYRVPLVQQSPVKIVPLEGRSSLTTPKKADDKKPLFAYIDWIESEKDASKEVRFTMNNHDNYQIQATVGEHEGVLVQMTYDSGWRVKSAQGKVKKEKDPLGFLLLRPEKPGTYEIALTHGPKVSQYIGWGITLLTTCFLVTRILKRSRKPTAQKETSS